MKKKLIIILPIIIIILIGSIFIGYSDNRVIFTIKNYVPLELRNFVKKSFFFPFFQQSEINKLGKINNIQTAKIDDLEDQILYLKEYLNDIDINKSQGTSFFLPQLLSVFQTFALQCRLIKFRLPSANCYLNNLFLI